MLTVSPPAGVVFTVAGTVGGGGDVTMSGAGTLVLSGTNTYDGTTAVNAGRLQLGVADALPYGAGKDLLSIGATTAGLDLGGHDQTLNGLSSTAAGYVTNSAGTALLTVGAHDASATFTGVLRDGGGVLGLRKIGAGAQALSGVVSARGGLTVQEGLLVLTGANTFTSGVTIAGGTLAIDADASLGGAASGVTFTGNGALSNSVAFTLTGPRTITVASNATATLIGTTTLTLAAPVAGPGNLTKTGPNTVILTASNAYAGRTTIEAGTLQVGSAGATGSLGAGETINQAALVFNRTGLLTHAGAIRGVGTVTKSGAGKVVLSGDSTYSGLTAVAAGVMNMQSATGLGSTNAGTTVANLAALELEGGIVTAAEPLTLAGAGVASGGALRSVSGTNRFSGAVTLVAASRINADQDMLTLGAPVRGAFALTLGGAGDVVVADAVQTGSTLTKDGAGVATLVTNNTYTTTAISAGTLRIGNGGPSGTLGSGITTLNGTLVFDRAGAYVYGSGITGGGTLIKEGPDSVTLGGANSYSGPTWVRAGTLLLTGAQTAAAVGTNTVQGGTLQIGASERIANGAAVVVDGGTFDIQSFNESVGTIQLRSGIIAGSSGVLTGRVYQVEDGTVSARLGGAAALTKSTAGTVVLGAANTYTGATLVAAGTLLVNGSLAARSTVTVAGGGTLGGAGVIAGAVTNLAGGTLAPGAAGLGTLSAASVAMRPGSVLAFEFSDAPANDQLLVSETNGLTIDGAGVLIRAAGTTHDWAVNGTYDLIRYAGAIGGAGVSGLTLLNPPPAGFYSFSVANGWVRLTLGAEPLLSIGDASVREGDAGQTSMVFTVSLMSPAAADVRADWQTVDGSAWAAFVDYAPTNGTVVIPAGSLATQIVVRVFGDQKVETPETFTVSLTNAVNAVLLQEAGTGTIFDDEANLGIQLVDLSAAGRQTGLNWDDAFTGVQAALDVAGTNAVWVATGVYRPAPAGASTTNRFAFRAGTRLHGGFVSGMSALAQRDPSRHETVLSGDLNGDDTPNFGGRSDNASMVVSCSGANGAVLDGFTISGGQGQGGRGGGLFVGMASPFLVSRCIITDNYMAASGLGAGMWCDLGATGTVRNCLFYGNRCEFRAAGFGIDGFTPPYASVVMINCTVTANVAQDEGDGVYARASAISVLTLRNAIVWGNDAQNPLQDNSPSGVQNIRSRGDSANAIVYVSYSDYNNALCSGDITDNGGQRAEDPLFASPGANDFHLKSKSGRWTPSGIVRDTETSPCVDAGDPADSCEEEPQGDPCRIDMGAYGGTVEAAGSEGAGATSGILFLVK